MFGAVHCSWSYLRRFSVTAWGKKWKGEFNVCIPSQQATLKSHLFSLLDATVMSSIYM